MPNTAISLNMLSIQHISHKFQFLLLFKFRREYRLADALMLPRKADTLSRICGFIGNFDMSNKNLTTEKKLQLIREINALADGVTLKYIQGLSDTISSPDAEQSEKIQAFAEIDKVLRIAKQ